MAMSLHRRIVLGVLMSSLLSLLVFVHTTHIVRQLEKLSGEQRFNATRQGKVGKANEDSTANANRTRYDNGTGLSANACPPDYVLYRKRWRRYEKLRQKGSEPPKDNRTDYNVLILTPISNSAGSLRAYFALLCSLTYPKDRIAVALGEDSSSDGSFELASDLAADVRPAFRSVTVYRLAPRRQAWRPHDKHSRPLQLRRRRHLAMARNQLLMLAMGEDYDWVVWLDSDLAYYPPGLIELLLSPAEPVVAPVCLWPVHGTDEFSVYDKNTWRETSRSIDFVAREARRNADFLMLEGYGPSRRLYLSDLRREGAVVRVDGVGGCALLVNASCHRSGLIFPPFVFDSHIETEAFGKMATRMDIKMYGLPFVSVIHE